MGTVDKWVMEAVDLIQTEPLKVVENDKFLRVLKFYSTVMKEQSLKISNKARREFVEKRDVLLKNMKKLAYCLSTESI